MKVFLLIFVVLISFRAQSANMDNIDIEPIPDLPIKVVPSLGVAQPISGWQVALGGGISYGPVYEGAADSRARFMPLIEASYNYGKFFISPLRGIGYNFSEDRDTQYGIRLAPGRTRLESIDTHLNGMGNINFTPEAGLFFNKLFSPWYISSGINTGNNGTHAELGAGIGFHLTDIDRLRLGVNLDWGDTKYNQTYFGVTDAQSVASDNVLTPYNASAGIKDYAITANWTHNFNKEWFGSGGLSYKWLTGSAEQSPLTQQESMARVTYLLGYRF
jgi:outer membrane protein